MSKNSRNNNPDSQRDQPHHDSRWALMGDIFVFQIKLIVDSIRDLVLVPVSLVAGLFGIIARPNNPAAPFHEVLALGKRSERMINLFGALPRNRQLKETLSAARSGGLDDVLGKLQSTLKEQYEKGGLTAGAKQTIDRSLDAVNRRVNREQKSDE